MTERFFLGTGHRMIRLPGFVMRKAVARQARGTAATLRFMTPDHHRVRNFAVTELVRTGAPIPARAFSEALELGAAAVGSILDELERRLTFVFRNDASEVTWAYPVTVDPTPHRARFHTGEQAYSP